MHVCLNIHTNTHTYMCTSHNTVRLCYLYKILTAKGTELKLKINQEGYNRI